jgi:hypothetical protein
VRVTVTKNIQILKTWLVLVDSDSEDIQPILSILWGRARFRPSDVSTKNKEVMAYLVERCNK